MKLNLRSLVAPAVIIASLSGNVFAQDLASIETKIKKLNKKFAEEMINGEFSTEYYTEDAISMPNNQPMLVGIEAIKASHEQMMASGIKLQSFSATPTKIMMNGDQVTEIGTFSISLMLPNMNTPVTDNGKYLTLWEIQENGDLKIKVETWNTDTMPQP